MNFRRYVSLWQDAAVKGRPTTAPACLHSARFAIPNPDGQPPQGTWWPHTRALVDQLTHLIHA